MTSTQTSIIPHYFKLLWSDLTSAFIIFKALRSTHYLIFSKRQKFWKDLQPLLDITNHKVMYPDAIQLLKIKDLKRARSGIFK